MNRYIAVAAATIACLASLPVTIGDLSAASGQTARLADRPYRPDGPYMDFARQSPFSDSMNVRFDRGGLPMPFQGGRYGHNPVTVAQYGLQADAYWRTRHAPVYRVRAQRAADWLVRNQDRASGRWEYHFSFDVGGMDITLQPPWSSAMAQGQAMSLLVRESWHTGRRSYLRAALRSLRPLRTPVVRGGLVARFRGHPIYEEFPTRPPSFALNGFMFTLIGLYDLSVAAPRSDAGRLYRQGLSSLLVALPYYDVGGLSAYHLGYLTNSPRAVHRSLYYHRIHVMLLAALDSVSPHSEFRRYRRKWAAYKPQPGDPS